MVFGHQSTRHPFNQLRHEVDRLLTGFLRPGDGLPPSLFRGQPLVNVWEQDDALKVEMELPGVKAGELDISVAADDLSIKVNRPDVAQEGVTYHRRERPVGSFGRIVHLPVPVDADRVEADLHDGVLTITLPKAESAKPRKINVSGT
jgi:HSP20 family protein